MEWRQDFLKAGVEKSIIRSLEAGLAMGWNLKIDLCSKLFGFNFKVFHFEFREFKNIKISSSNLNRLTPKSSMLNE